MPDVDRFGRLPWLWITVLVFVLDQVSKAFFQAELSMYQQIVVIPDLFSWTLAYNTGAAFSFLADSSGWQRWLFALIAIVVSAILVVWLKRLKKGETWLAIALALVLGGALGNLLRPHGPWPRGGLHPGALAEPLVLPGVQPGR